MTIHPRCQARVQLVQADLLEGHHPQSWLDLLPAMRPMARRHWDIPLLVCLRGRHLRRKPARKCGAGSGDSEVLAPCRWTKRKKRAHRHLHSKRNWGLRGCHYCSWRNAQRGISSDVILGFAAALASAIAALREVERQIGTHLRFDFVDLLHSSSGPSLHLLVGVTVSGNACSMAA